MLLTIYIQDKISIEIKILSLVKLNNTTIFTTTQPDHFKLAKKIWLFDRSIKLDLFIGGGQTSDLKVDFCCCWGKKKSLSLSLIRCNVSFTAHQTQDLFSPREDMQHPKFEMLKNVKKKQCFRFRFVPSIMYNIQYEKIHSLVCDLEIHLW